MTSRLAIGQTVVTDPIAGRSSGYVMVAASESVQPAEAQHLTVAPQVTDFLHLESSPGPFFSFYPLPSGRWAVVKRFVRGTRRGAYNRVVVHTLLVPREVLAAVCEEPWLLVTKCRFRPCGGGPEATPAELGERAAEAGLESLPDLECVLPADPQAERYALLNRRRTFLRQRWGEEALRDHLAAIFAALAAERRVLLPQKPEAVELMALAWSMLPVADRLAVAWTTHLAPAAGSLFRLANAPEAETMRSEPSAREEWVVPLRQSLPPDPAGGSAALAAAIVSGEPPPEALHEGFRHHALSLRTGSARVRRWIAWLGRGGADVLRGFGDEKELAELLHQFRLDADGAVSDPWLSPARFLCCAGASILRLHAGGRGLEEATRAVARVLRDTRWYTPLLEPAVISALTELDDADAAAQVAPVAVALALRDLPSPPRARGPREVLLRLLLAAPRLSSAGASEHPFLARVLVELGVDLARCESPTADGAFERLAALEGGLAAAARELRPQAGDLPLMLAIVRAAKQEKNLEAGAGVAARSLFPLLESQPALLMEIPAADFTHALRALRGAPEVMTALLRRSPEPLYDAAVAELRHWARRRWRVALKVAEEVALGSRDEPIRVRPALRGLAESLARLAPAAVWLPFALAEAGAGDAGPETERLTAFLATAEIDAETSRTFAPQVLDQMRQAIAGGQLSEQHRLLVGALGSGLVAAPEKCVAVLAELSHLPSAAYLRWGETVAQVADALEASGRGGEASQLRANWWRGLATRRWEAFPTSVLPMLAGLQGADRRTVAELWVGKIARLGGQPGERELVGALSKIAAPDAEYLFKYNVGVLAGRVNLGRIGLVEAVGQAEGLTRSRPDRPQALRRALATLLPAEPGEMVQAVVTLLLSPGILPVTKRVLERSFRDPSLERAGDELGVRLPPVEELARRGGLLLRVAFQHGKRWRRDPAVGEDFLRQAVRLGRFDAVAAFLGPAEKGRRGFLERLAREGDRGLLYQIGKAARQRVSGTWLWPFAGRLRQLQAGGIKGRSKK